MNSTVITALLSAGIALVSFVAGVVVGVRSLWLYLRSLPTTKKEQEVCSK